MTVQEQRVVLLFLRDPSRRYYDLETAREAGLQRGTLYPILARLEGADLVTSEWEEINPHPKGRLPRRSYTLTNEGLRQALQVRDSLAAALPPSLATVGL